MKLKSSVFIIRLLGWVGLALFSNQTSFAQTCPAGWTVSGSGCKANLPSSDYIDNGPYPGCGGNPNNGYRIPVLPTFEPLPVSTSYYYPNTRRAYGGSYHSSVKYTRGKFGLTDSITDDPTYVFDTLTRCVCIDRMGDSPRYTTNNTTILTAPDQGIEPYPTGNVLPNANGTPRIYPDTIETISKQDHQASKKYNMVAYGNDYYGTLVDGRIGENFRLVGAPASSARCGCPNINENPVLNGTDSTGGIVGYHCQPKVVTPMNGGRVLTTYNANMVTDVINVNDDSLVNGSAGPVVKKILLPNLNGESIEYSRKIWTCAEPYTLTSNGANSTCKPPVQTDHTCDNDLSAGWTDTSVSPAVYHTVNDTINKKLACCLNENTSAGFASGTRMRFDCAANSSQNYATFDDLWLSQDDTAQGGQFNALLLMGTSNIPSTGFYTLDGNRCNEFSELSGTPIDSVRISRNAQGAWAESASTLPDIPASALVRNGWSGKIPTTPVDKLRCPIVVRAAMVATCPVNPALPALQKSWNFSDKIQCPSASSIQVHVRMEQVYEIDGVPTMKPIDTIMDKRLAFSINVEKIISDKNGTNCPRGTSKKDQACAYQ